MENNIRKESKNSSLDSNSYIKDTSIYTIGKDCETAILSDKYIDIIVPYNDEEELKTITSRLEPECMQLIDGQFAILYRKFYPFGCIDIVRSRAQERAYSIPTLVSPYGKSSLDASGILLFHDRPYLTLRGQGVLIGIVDSGIDYTNDVFKYEDGTSKIVSIWDQTIQGSPPDNYKYGTEYSNEQINEALNSVNPFNIVPTIDETGHGTFLAGIAAGREDVPNNFIGAAPDSMIVVVKLKQAKKCIKEVYFIEDETTLPVYQTNDVMTGVDYLVQKGLELGMPISIIIGLGSNVGAHDGTGVLEQYLADVGLRRGHVVSVAAGNEAISGQHYKGIFLNGEKTKDIEINVAKNESGFLIYIWNEVPDKMSVSVTSPSGESVPRIPLRVTKGKRIELIFEDTSVYIQYDLVEKRTGDQYTIIRIERPSQGIWRITLHGDLIVNGTFNMWLPRKGYIKDETRFLRPNPFTTITYPSSTIYVMTVGAYNHIDDSIFIESGRGLTRDLELKPDIVAPGVDIIGPFPNNQFGLMTGTSVSAAIAAGAAALLLEWGIVWGNDIGMSTIKITNYLKKGARRKEDMMYPNREWGSGALDLLGVFEMLAET